MYKLTPSHDDSLLFYRLDGESIERHGAIGYFRADFGSDGFGFYISWHDIQPHLKTREFRRELDSVVNGLRVDGNETPFANRMVLETYITANPGKELARSSNGYMVRTEGYSYYFRCLTSAVDYDIYCFAYDNRYLLPELAGQHRLPIDCYSVLPSTGELILIVREKHGYFPTYNSTPFPDINRSIANESNAHCGVTKGQEEAMLAGSLFGWDNPAAKPWNYDVDGNSMFKSKKKSEPER